MPALIRLIAVSALILLPGPLLFTPPLAAAASEPSSTAPAPQTPTGPAAISQPPGSDGGAPQAPGANADEPVIVGGQPLESILGREVRTTSAEDMGRIVDVLADQNCRVRAVVIEFGGFLGIGTRKIAIEWSALRFDTQTKPPIVILDMSRDQLRKLPEYKPRVPEVGTKAVN